MLPVLLSLAALATGLPPMDTVTLVGDDCAAVEGPVRALTLTYDRITGSCAPRPGGDPCHTWVEASLDATALVVRRADCEEPMPGAFVRSGVCGEVPRWRWTGRLDAGHAHLVGLDFTPGQALVAVAGDPTDAACPALSPRTHPVRTTPVVTRDAAPQWLAFPADGYRVVADGDRARLTWTPGPLLVGWVLGDGDATLQSDALPPADAEAALAEARRMPTGLAVRHRVVEVREHFEGWTQRGAARCERVMEMDLEQRLRLGSEGERLGPPMTATVRLREAAAAPSCGSAVR